MDLYLILFSITALGVFALILIFVGQNKRNFFASSDENDEIELDNILRENEEDFPAIKAERNTPEQKTDPVLASLGFSAYDGLLSEPKRNNVHRTILDDDPPIGDIDSLVEDEVIPSVNDFSTDVDAEQVAKPVEDKNQIQDFIIFYAKAPNLSPYVGYELLQALLATGLRFGEMNIFHRYADADENILSTKILFSVASAVEPGIFDVDNMGGFSCPGLSFFMSLNIDDPKQTLDLLIETANQLIDDLGGTLYDTQKRIVTEEIVEEYRQKFS